MFVTGKVDNTGDKTIEDWINTVERIQPLSVQIYTLDRSPQDIGILAVEEKKLMEISDKLKSKTKIPSSVFS